MSWKSILASSKKRLGGHAPYADLSRLGLLESTVLIERVQKLAKISNHPFVSVLYTHIDNCPNNIARLRKVFARGESINAFPESMVIPMFGQAGLHFTSNNKTQNLDSHRKIGEIYSALNIALALHRSVRELPDPSNKPDKEWLQAMESGNKLAVLAGDILLASASVALAEFHITKVVELISGSIADAIRAEFSDLMLRDTHVPEPSRNLILKQWLDHVLLRHGALLGDCCAATLIINSLGNAPSRELLPARRFGTAWACLARLIKERNAVRKALSSGTKRQKSMMAIGYTQSGLPEPTLADLSFVCLDDETGEIAEGIYADVADQMTNQIKESISTVLPPSGMRGDVEELAAESVSFLIQEAQ